MNDELLFRVRRIYAAVNASQEFDLDRLPAKIRRDAGVISIFQDFMGELGKEDVQNIALAAVHNIVNLEGHLRRWARSNGKSTDQVEQTLKNSQALRILKDLSNNDKHGYPPRKSGESGVAPQLAAIARVMRLTTGPETGSSVAMTLGPGGVPRISGSGTARAVITGDVLDRDGNRLGDLLDIELEGVRAWEELLQQFGLVDRPLPLP